MRPDERCACGVPAVRTLAAIAYCYECSEAILEPIRARVLADEGGVGKARRRGPMRPEYGRFACEAVCGLCGASWVADIVGEPCSWCIDRVEALVDATRRAMLRPDPDMIVTAAQRRTFGRLLANAVRSEIVSEREARAVLARIAAEVVVDDAAA